MNSKKWRYGFFVRSYAANKVNPAALKERYTSEINSFGATKARLSFKVSNAMYSDLERASDILGENKTETLKLAAFDFYNRTIEMKEKSTISKLKDIAYMS